MLGTVTANVMFGLPAVQVAGTVRSGSGVLLAEFVATGGLVLVVWAVSRRGGDRAVAAIPLWVGAGMYSTASTCFANPAVSLARTLSDTFTGIRPSTPRRSSPSSCLAGLAATLLAAYLFAGPLPAQRAILAHEEA